MFIYEIRKEDGYYDIVEVHRNRFNGRIDREQHIDIANTLEEAKDMRNLLNTYFYGE